MIHQGKNNNTLQLRYVHGNIFLAFQIQLTKELVCYQLIQKEHIVHLERNNNTQFSFKCQLIYSTLTSWWEANSLIRFPLESQSINNLSFAPDRINFPDDE